VDGHQHTQKVQVELSEIHALPMVYVNKGCYQLFTTSM